MPNDPPIRVLVVEHHTLFRKGLVNLLCKQREFEVVGEAATARTAMSKARQLAPDIILMDVFMPGIGGLQAATRIRRESPNVPIVMLTASDDEQGLAEAIKSGAQGYLRKEMEPEGLFSTLIRAVPRDDRRDP